MGGNIMIEKGIKSTNEQVFCVGDLLDNKTCFEGFEGFEPFAVSDLSKQQELYHTPIIPESVYNNLPQILKNGSSLFQGRERDIWLISAITVLSGMFPTISGGYRYDEMFPNLFSFIIAPQASGKAVMKFSKMLGNPVHNQKLLRYREELEDFKKALKARKGKQVSDDLIKPDPKLLFIPGDTSSTALINLLNANDGVGIICESEADTLTTALQKDWGNFSDKLRNAFDNTEVSYTRSTTKDYITVKEPKLAVAITGTPDQLPKLIGSAENGLLTRNIFYVFNSQYNFDSIAPKSNGNTKQIIVELSEQVEKLYNRYIHHRYAFSLSEKQINAVTDYFSEAQEFVCENISEKLNGFIIRMAVISYKIAMILAALNQNLDKNYQLSCSDNDINTALKMSQVFLQHAVAVYLQLYKSAGRQLTAHQIKVLNKLPDDSVFTRAEAVERCKVLGKSSRATDTALKKLCSFKYLEHLDQGMYKKINK